MSKKLLLLPAALALLALAGCDNYTGGGQVPGQNYSYDGSLATFGFATSNKAIINSGQIKGGTNIAGTWSDGPVRFSFSGPLDSYGSTGTCGWSDFTYKSTNKATPGSGTGHGYVCDGSPDYASVWIDYSDAGPYAGYSAGGDIINGQIKAGKSR